MSTRYAASEAMLDRALRTIPLGSQTFSKSLTQYPHGVSPYFIKRGKGAHVWDVDGNQYVDFVSSLCSVTLGYCDPDVDAAVRAQLEEGVIFSLPHPVEAEVAEAIVEMVPCAEMVRFGKNGSDATAGAVRIARAHTKRDRVAVCGYHGWQDWYIGSTARNAGVPAATKELTHTFAYNDVDSLVRLLDTHPGEFAAIVIEPMNVVYPEPGFLESVREIATKRGAVLIFDETITGFRFSKGGAQELFGVVPDLATFGKGLANGFPLSAIAGRADLMRWLEEVFFSFTFGGETLSLAASKATLDKLRREPVLETIRTHGDRLVEALRSLVQRHDAGHLLSVSGHPSWSFLNLKATADYDVFTLKTYLLQELFARGLLTLGSHNLSYAHGEPEITGLLKAYEEVVPRLVELVAEKRVIEALDCKPLQPLFKVR